MTAPTLNVDALERVLVYGVGVTGRAVARSLNRRGVEVVLADDSAVSGIGELARELGVEHLPGVEGARLAEVVGGFDAVAPSPGVPATHPLFAAARSARTPVASELDLAEAWTDVPMVAVTGTNGKTTVTTLVAKMLQRSGMSAPAVGNTEVPLVEAVDSDPSADVYVVEASSFRLAPVQLFAPRVAVALNLAPDHLDWHGSYEAYGAAKVRITAMQGPRDLLVLGAGEPDLEQLTSGTRARRITAGSGTGDVRWDRDHRVLEGAEAHIVLDSPPRLARPHDLANAAAAAVAALELGADAPAVAEVIAEFEGISHRQQLVGSLNGVVWVNDSKATAPHATAAALEGYESIVLIAGGRNKGLDLGVLARHASRVKAVVAVGESAQEIGSAFAGVKTVGASSMAEAVELAAGLADAGDTVLLSPACASHDWYASYVERGEDFVRLARERGVRP